jgi:hypothetical protein
VISNPPVVFEIAAFEKVNSIKKYENHKKENGHGQN